jgi:hypothetical protein
MKRALRIFILYILPVLIFISYFEINLTQIDNLCSKKKWLLERDLNNIEVLVLGNSHALNGINPQHFQFPGFNLANVSQSHYYDAQLLSRYLPRMPRLKIVLIVVDYFTLEYNFSRSSEYWRTFFYERVFGFPPELNNHNLDIKRFSLIELYGREYMFFFLQNHFSVDMAGEMRSNGFVERLGGTVGDKPQNRIEVHHSIMDKRNILNNVSYLEGMIVSLKQKSVMPVIVSMPTTRGYFRHIDQEKYHRMQANIKLLCQQYDIPYFDFFGKGGSLADKLFSDYDHLSLFGSEVFSKKLNRDILIKYLGPPREYKGTEKRNLK